MSRASVAEWIRPEILAMSAYHVAPAEGMIKLDAMENPYTWPSKLIDAWLDLLRTTSVNRYPDPDAVQLKAALREYFGFQAETELLLGNGSDEIILMLALAVAGSNKSALALEPSFSMYRIISALAGLQYVGVPLNADDFGVDQSRLFQALDRYRPAITFLASPNNPTGNLIDLSLLEKIARAAPGIIVVDEAYVPFAQQSAKTLLSRNPNLLLMQTLSKIGLAGLRLGVLAGSRDLVCEIDKVRLPYNVSTLSQISARFMLKHADELRVQASQICRDRDDLYAAMEATRDLKVWPSRANFIAFRTRRRRATEVHAHLRNSGVLVKCLHDSHPLLDNCLRVSVGTPRENDAFLRGLRTALTA